jgi:dipeptidyl aminopeptidase/acylaminoacyl peptidase
MRTNKYKIWFFIFIFFISVYCGYFYYKNNFVPLKIQPPNLTGIIHLKPSSSPTQFLFQETTIPYLRNQKFESALEELKKISDNGQYENYLTSYTSDGLKINALLTKPKIEKPQNGFPAVIFIHGYIPPKQYQTLSNYSAYVDFLARRNLVVFKLDLRGHGESEGEASGAYYSGDYIIDILNAYQALKNTDFVDTDKISLWGHSMGGNVVLRTLAAKPEIKKGVIWAGAVYTYSDMQKYRIADASYQPPPDDTNRQRRRKLLFDTYGEFDPNHQFWKKVPATNYLDGLNFSLQLHHAINDNVVNIGYSRDLAQILDNFGIKYELFEYPNGGHNIEGTSFSQAMQKTAEFLAE